MKKLLNVLIITLALNFLAAAGGVAWLNQTGRLNGDKARVIYGLVFDPPPPATQPTKIEERDPSTPPTLKLEELLAKRSRLSAADQVDFIQSTFDAQTAQLDRRLRDLNDMDATIRKGQSALDDERKKFDQERQQFVAMKEESLRLQTDKGFQDSLQRYAAMPPRQVKAIFMRLDEKTMTQYLRAMEPRNAAMVLKEFKTEPEIQRAQMVLERMRQADATTKPAAPPSDTPATAGTPAGE